MNRLKLVRAGLTALLLATTLVGVAPASSASAARHSTFEYDALGDSYASGYGVPPYNLYGQSPAAYAVQLDGRMRIDLDDFVARAGAKSADIAAQLGALDADTDLVTISVGGNDIGWGDAVGACLAAAEDFCLGAVTVSESQVTNVLPVRLNSVYTAISAAAPNAHVIVVGYPRLFSPKYGDYAAGPYLATVAEQRILNEGADLLNAVIAQAAAEHGFQFVDVTRRFSSHGVNAPNPWIVGPLVQNAALHPNAAGYRAYTAALTAAIVPARLR